MGFRIKAITEDSGPSYVSSNLTVPTIINLNFIDMITIDCPKCKKPTSFEMVRDAIDEEGEVYRCKHCGWPFRYVYK